VRDAVVVVREEDDSKNKRLIAYVAPKESREKEQLTNELRSFLKLRLPPFMLPASFVFREAMPVTANGKIDRAALESATETTRCGQLCGVRSVTEQTLTEIWAHVLKLEQVGVNDNFFDLGGDSVLAAQILARATRAGLPLTPKQFFEHQTIAELSALLDGRNGSRMNLAVATELNEKGRSVTSLVSVSLWGKVLSWLAGVSEAPFRV
jgi:aryl carrier-like protein